MKQIIERLEAARKQKSLSYEKVAELAELAKGNVFKALTGKSDPAASTLFKIAEALGFKFIMMPIAECTFKPVKNSINELMKPQPGDFGLMQDVPKKAEEGVVLFEINERQETVQSIVEGGKKKIVKPELNLKKKGNIDLGKKPSKIAEHVAAIKEQSECPNCKYTETGTGLRIRILKCDEHKTNKTKKK